MLRNGVKLRARNADFASSSISSDEMNLDTAVKNQTSPPIKKKKNRKRNQNEKVIVEQSSNEEPVVAKKKKSKKSKIKKADDQHVASERKIVRGRRRLQRQENVDGSPTLKSPSPVKKTPKKSPVINPDKLFESPLVQVKVASQKKSAPRTTLRSMTKSSKSEDKENESLFGDVSSIVTESFIKSPNKIKYLVQTDDNLIETSVEKYTKSHAQDNKKVNLFDQPYDLSFEEIAITKSPIKNMVSKKAREENIEKSNEAKKRDTFEIPNNKSFTKKQSATEPLKDCTVVITDNKSKKRGTFEVKNDDVAEPNAKKRNTRQFHSETLTEKSKKRETFEIKPVTDEETVEFNERRGTFDINANGILPITKRRGTYELDPEQIKTPEIKQFAKEKKPVQSRSTRSVKRESLKREVKKAPSTVVVRKSVITPASVHKKRLNLPLVKDSNKIKISDSKTSLSESGMSSPSMLLRRAQKMNPPSLRTSTPNASICKITPPKRKTPQHSTSKVKKVPNYSAIHQNAYEKMESVDDHMRRKADRAKALLSGAKIPLGVKRTPHDMKTKKQLFSTTLPSDIKPIFNFNNNKHTNSPIALSARRFGAGDASLLETPKKHIKKTVGFNGTTPAKARLQPVRFAKTPRPTKEEILDAYGTKIPRHVAPPPLFTTGTSVVPHLKGGNATVVVEKPINKMLRLKEVASVSTKSKASTTTVDSRRNHIKGVRSNRRFDLLMSMRK